MKAKTILNVFLIFILVLVNFAVWIGAHVYETEAISNRENRVIYHFPILTFQAFFDQTFQDNFEKAIIDQMPKSAKIKEEWNKLKSNFQHLTYRFLSAFGQEKDLYIPKGKDLYEIASSGHIIPFIYKAERPEILKQRFAVYCNDMSRVPAEHRPRYYLYYIEGVYDIHFMKRYTSHDCVSHALYETIQDVFSKVGKTATLRLESLEDYQKFYYKTDHHYNYIGQLQTYQGCIRLLLGEEEPFLNHRAVLIENTRLVGSRSRQLDEFSKSEDFIVNDYDLPEQKIHVLGLGEANQHRYGRAKEYVAGKFNDSIEVNHYGECFGQDVGLITINTLPYRENREDLLIIADSFSNPVNIPISAHFNTTFVVDLRYYKKHTGKEFSLSAFVAENNIDKVLFLGTAGIYLLDEYRLEPEQTSNSEVHP